MANMLAMGPRRRELFSSADPFARAAGEGASRDARGACAPRIKDHIVAGAGRTRFCSSPVPLRPYVRCRHFVPTLF